MNTTENQEHFALRPQKRGGLLGTGAQDAHLDFHPAPDLWCDDDDEVLLNVLRCRLTY